MPSSLVFAALVLAWLVVLVPVVARRRQMVPRPAEADLSARVLPRTVGTPASEELPVTMTSSARTSSGAAGSTATAVIERDRLDLDAELDGELELDAYDGEDERGRGTERVVRAADVDQHRDQDDDREDDDRDDAERYADGYADEDADEDDYAEDDYADDDYADDDYADDDYADDADGYAADDLADDAHDADDEPAVPRSYRPGRGGFDPDAAAEAAQSRYAFRQRVAVGLIAVAVLSAVAALVVTSALWSLHLLADVVLVGYLVFLRRQTRLEEDLRARRAARLSGERRAIEARRARQAEHEARMAAVRRESAVWHHEDVEDDHDDVAYDEDDEVDVEEAPRWAAPRTPAPPVPAGMELVDDSSDDPDFHPLDGRERVPSYRRASGA